MSVSGFTSDGLSSYINCLFFAVCVCVCVQVLDRLLLYLRLVHSVDYYNFCEYPAEDEMPHRCGLIHVRGPLPVAKITAAEGTHTHTHTRTHTSIVLVSIELKQQLFFRRVFCTFTHILFEM